MRFSLLFITLFFLLGCAEDLPEGILSAKKITPVLVDMHLAEALYSQPAPVGISRENYQGDLYLSVLKKYNLDRKVFEASLLYYGKHPDKYKPIYDDVLDKLSEMEAKLRINDSIARIKKTMNPAIDTANTVIPIDTVKTDDTIKTVTTVK